MLAQLRGMKKHTFSLVLATALLLGGCSALPFGHKDKMRAAPRASADVDPGLKIAVDVVMSRLRDAEQSDLRQVSEAAPEIFQLAAALMPPAQRGGRGSKRAHYTSSFEQPNTLGDIQRRSKGASFAANTLGAAMNGAQVHRASYNAHTAQDITPAPSLSNARSLMHAIHLGSYRTAARAYKGYAQIKSQTNGALAGLDPRVERVDLGPQKGIYERLKAGPFASRAEAQAKCTQIRATGVYCAPADFTGRAPG